MGRAEVRGRRLKRPLTRLLFTISKDHPYPPTALSKARVVITPRGWHLSSVTTTGLSASRIWPINVFRSQSIPTVGQPSREHPASIGSMMLTAVTKVSLESPLDKVFNVVVSGVKNNFFGCPCLHQHTIFHDGNSVSQTDGFFQVVGDENRGFSSSPKKVPGTALEADAEST